MVVVGVVVVGSVDMVEISKFSLFTDLELAEFLLEPGTALSGLPELLVSLVSSPKRESFPECLNHSSYVPITEFVNFRPLAAALGPLKRRNSRMRLYRCKRVAFAMVFAILRWETS